MSSELHKRRTYLEEEPWEVVLRRQRTWEGGPSRENPGLDQSASGGSGRKEEAAAGIEAVAGTVAEG